MSVLEDFEMREFRLNCARPLKSAAGTIKERYGYLFCLKSEDALGIGEASPLPGWTESFKACREALRHGMESIKERGVERSLYEIRGTPAARHGISLSCQDLKAKEQERPLYQFLSDDDREVSSISVNAVVGNGTPDETARHAERRAEENYETIKVKAGRQTFEQDLVRLEAVRSALGDSIQLRVDANGNWSLEQIREHADRLEAIDLEYIEQPFPEDNLADHTELSKDFDVALDESLYEFDLGTIIDEEAADVIVLKPMCLGGLDRTMKFGERILEAGLVPVVTTTIDTVVARTAAVHLAAAMDEMPACGLATAQFLEEDLCEDPAPVINGRINVPQKPGLGVDEAWQALE
jgi:o-succinylbenzoate synthase